MAHRLRNTQYAIRNTQLETNMTTIGYALLGLLAREPRSGYELAKELKVPVSFFWYAPHSQIYPELARLEAAGLVTHEKVEQQNRPSKKVYSLTEAGRGKLRELGHISRRSRPGA